MATVTQELRNKIVSLAKAEVKPNIHWWGDNNQYTHQVYSPNVNRQWCNDFVAWVFDKLDGSMNLINKTTSRDKYIGDIIGFNKSPGMGYAQNTLPWFKEKGRFVKITEATGDKAPEKGDIVYFESYGSTGGIYVEHVGIVSDVNKATKQIKYISGNSPSDTVTESGWLSYSSDGAKYTPNTEFRNVGLPVSVPGSGQGNLGVAGFGKLGVSSTPNLRQDTYESNNTRGTAKALSGESGILNNLTLHTASDEDWFKFDWHGDGTASNQIRLSTTSSNECFDLYSPSGSLLRSNTTIATLAPYDRVGTYYVKVHGVNGSTSKNYALMYNLKRNIRPDNYESNNSRYTATPLNGSRGSLSNLTLHTGTDEDWFRVTLNGRGTTRDTISVSNSSGGECIRLYNTSGVQVKGWGRDMSFDGLSAGTYYAKVYNRASVPSSRYTLTWSIPSVASSNSTGSGSSSGASGSASSNNNSLRTATYLYASSGTRSDSISRSGEQDYFRIQLNSRGTSNNYVQTSFVHSRGDIDMELLDSSGRVLTTSNGSGNTERISLSGKSAGTYYVRVKGYSNATNSYSISWNTASGTSNTTPSNSIQREYEPNNNWSSADSLSGSSGTLKGSIGSSGDEDWFRFTLNGEGNSNNKIEITQGSTQRVVLYDANRNQIGSKLYKSVSLANRSAGTYYVKVYDSVGFRSGDYTLSWNTASNSRSTSAATSRAATPSLTSAQNVMYDSAAGAFAGYLNSAGAATQAVSQSTSDSLRKYGTLVQA